jgi:predicted dehydrogenase
MKKRIAIAGTGTRALNFADGITKRCKDTAELVALYDLNDKRMQGFCELIGQEVPSYTDFDQMTAEQKPDTLLVCVTDKAHPELIEMAFAHDMDAVVEKPLAMDRQGLKRIYDAEKQYGRKVKVTFNLRFAPYSAKIKEVLMQKPIGEIKSVSAEWFIDKTHGIEYFHRWHNRMENGGGLLVHKATHNFDLLNWFLNDTPEQVFAYGSLQQYGAAGPFRGPNCRQCEHKNDCWAAMKVNLLDEDLNPGSEYDIFSKLYFETESVDGYLRDQCCFDPQIDIYDTMNAVIKYRGGTQVSYSLNAFSPWQGYNIVFTGTEGRMEVGTINPGTRPANLNNSDSIRIIRGQTRQDISLKELSLDLDQSPHGGGDWLLIDKLFGSVKDDPLGQIAGFDAGALSALVGICANESIKQHVPVELPAMEN